MPDTSRRKFLKQTTALCSSMSLTGLAACSQRKTTARPHVLFIAVDDLKPTLGCYGDTHAKSPNIDALAAVGTRFDAAYCQMAICHPSRASLLTGMRPERLGIYNLKTPIRDPAPTAITLPQHFAAHGYQTTSIGKIFHVKDPDSWHQSIPIKSEQYHSQAAIQRLQTLTAEADNKQLSGKQRQRFFQRQKFSCDAGDAPDDAYPDGKIAEAACQHLRQAANSSTPQFLAVGFHKPHLPFACPKKYWDLYERQTLPLAEHSDWIKGATRMGYSPSWELRGYSDVRPAQWNDPLPIDEAKARELVHGYYACTSFVDAQIGRVLKELQDLGMADNTIIVLWGDHGFHLGDHGMWCKHSTMEQATRSPLIVSLPGQAGHTSNALTEFIDIYPSLAELAGLPAPENLDGRSFAALLTKPDMPFKDTAFSLYHSHLPEHVQGGMKVFGTTLRTKHLRYTRWVRRADGRMLGEELYDYRSDPLETRNHITDAGYARALAQLRARCDSHLSTFRSSNSTQ